MLEASSFTGTVTDGPLLVAAGVAALVGLIGFLSPCVLPLVPGYISAVAGVAPSEIRPRRVIGPSLAFVASFSAIFIALGLLGQQALGEFETIDAAGHHHVREQEVNLMRMFLPDLQSRI